jgi:hypothetical protein
MGVIDRKLRISVETDLSDVAIVYIKLVSNL